MRERFPGYDWFAYLATDGGVMFVPRKTREECVEYHTVCRRSMETKTGRKIAGGWSEGPDGERHDEWGNHELRVLPVFHVFQSSQNKNRHVFCLECKEHIPNGGKYRPYRSLHLCLPCAERMGV